MEMTKQVEMPVTQLFYAIQEAFYQDYQQNVEQPISKEELQAGIQYIKHFGSKGQHAVRVKLATFQAPVSYEVLLSSNRGTQKMAYHLTAIDAHQTEITYVEEVVSNNIFQKANMWLMHTVFKKSYLRRMEAQLTGLIRYSQQFEERL